jgi:hypothetical protein
MGDNRDASKTCKIGKGRLPVKAPRLKTKKYTVNDVHLNGYRGCGQRPDVQGREEVALINAARGPAERITEDCRINDQGKLEGGYGLNNWK